MKWKDKLIRQFIQQSDRNTHLNKIVNENIGIHLAVFQEPFLSLIYSGEKKIESRFSLNKVSPFKRIQKGDLVLLKAPGKPVSGYFEVGEVSFYNGENRTWLNEIQTLHSDFICAKCDPFFWQKKAKANYATLIQIENFKQIIPIKTDKTDRSAWTILKLRKEYP